MSREPFKFSWASTTSLKWLKVVIKFYAQVVCHILTYGTDVWSPLKWAWSGSHDPFFNFDARNHISGMAEARVAKICRLRRQSVSGASLRLIDCSLVGVFTVTWLVFLNFAPIMSSELMKLYALPISCAVWYSSRPTSVCVIYYPQSDVSESRDVLKFWEISDNISKTVQDRELET